MQCLLLEEHIALRSNDFHLADTTHSCTLCQFTIELDIDEVVASEPGLSETVRQGLVYIGGYILHQIPDLKDLEDEDSKR